MRLTPKQQRFVNEYCVDENATQAALRAGYSERGAGQTGHSLLKIPEIKRAVAERMAELVKTTGITPEFIVCQWAKIATADVGDLVQVRRNCCRHCYGINGEYQWTSGEYTNAVNKAIESGQTPPDGMGGFGFDANKPPVDGCPECHGNGVESVFVTDTTKVRGDARLLYNGAEKTKYGVKVNIRDRDHALNNLAKYLGMFVEKRELSGIGGRPIAIANLKAEDFTDEQLAQIIGELEVEDDSEP